MTTLSSSAPALSLVMPCYNEEECLRHTAGQLLAAFAGKKIPLELILVDNGSRDRTAHVIDSLIAEGQPVVKVSVPDNIGYGNGILQGLKRARAPMIGYLCADGQVPPEGALETYELAMAAGKPVLAKVRRRHRTESLRRKVVSLLYNFTMPLFFGWMGTLDLNASPKFMRREFWMALDLQSTDWFLDPEVMIKARHLKLPVVEFEVEGRSRQGGASNVRIVTCIEFMRNVLRYRFGSPLARWKKSLSQRASVAQTGRAPAATPGRNSPQ